MTLKVFFPEPLSEEERSALLERLREPVEVLDGPQVPEPPEYHVLVSGQPERQHLEASQVLRALIVPWAGVPQKVRRLVQEFPHVEVYNLHHNAAATAEVAVALLLAAAKRVLPLDQAIRKGDWTARYEPSQVLLLDGKTALILGYGHIGQQVARVCQALGMRVLATRRRPDAPAPGDIDAEVYPPGALEDLLPRADILVVTLPHTEETTGLIGAEELALLPERAILVNVGRGPVVEEQALYEALRDGRIHSAGIDVWYQYPKGEEDRTNTFPSRYPFHELDNVVMSPHRGGAAMEMAKPQMAHLGRLLDALARGESVPNRVDLEAGY